MSPSESKSRLRRAIHPMPGDVWQAIVERGLETAYRQRPPYQQNDYVGWIEQAKRSETREKRLTQMLNELAAGDTYMNMAWRGRPRQTD